MTKEQLRKELHSIRNGLKDTISASCQIAKLIVREPFFQNAGTVMLYHATKSEIVTDFLWEKCVDEGKTCLFPKCISKTEMIAVRAENKTEFQTGAYGIMEPISSTVYPKEKIDLIIVPGLGFDKEKFRIGYGAGYYDRYLSDYTGISVGLSREALLKESVFPASHDVKLSYIATEKQIF